MPGEQSIRLDALSDPLRLGDLVVPITTNNRVWLVHCLGDMSNGI